MNTVLRVLEHIGSFILRALPHQPTLPRLDVEDFLLGIQQICRRHPEATTSDDLFRAVRLEEDARCFGSRRPT